jgi:hypothetical protein
MSILKSKIILIPPLILLALFVFFGIRDGGRKERKVIDLDNSPITKNDGSIEQVSIANKEMIQVRFSWEAGGIKYNDALNIPKDQYEKMTPQDIEKLKEERFIKWVDSVNASSMEQGKEPNQNE